MFIMALGVNGLLKAHFADICRVGYDLNRKACHEWEFISFFIRGGIVK